MISSKNLSEALYKISKENQNADILVDNFLEYVKDNNLISLMPQTIEHLERLSSSLKEFNTLKIHSGLPISYETTNLIQEKLKIDKDVKKENHVDSELIGGFIASYKGVLYDASLKNQLRLLKNSLTK